MRLGSHNVCPECRLRELVGTSCFRALESLISISMVPAISCGAIWGLAFVEEALNIGVRTAWHRRLQLIIGMPTGANPLSGTPRLRHLPRVGMLDVELFTAILDNVLAVMVALTKIGDV